MQKQQIQLTDYIRNIPDWPKKGILFRDITPLLKDASAFAAAVDAIADEFSDSNIKYVAAVEARGFIFGAAVAKKLGAGFVPVRKKGKLPYKTESVTYSLEYGTDTLEVHQDAVEPGSAVLMVDDLLATGGTMAAACELIEKTGARVAGVAFVIELTDLKGREKIKGRRVCTLIKY